MDLTPHVDHLRQQLAVIADGAGAAEQPAIDRLVAALESPLRLTLLEALSTAADEITRELAPGSVDVRLRGGDADLVVTMPEPDEPASPRASRPPPPEPEPGEGTARINLRLPEHLKAGIEQAADAEHVSINAWLVRLVAAALSPDDVDSGPRPRGGRVGQSWTGWAR